MGVLGRNGLKLLVFTAWKVPYSKLFCIFRSLFSVFGLNTERYSVSPRIHSECGKIRTRITTNTNTPYAVITVLEVSWNNHLIIIPIKNKVNRTRENKWSNNLFLLGRLHLDVPLGCSSCMFLLYYNTIYGCNKRCWDGTEYQDTVDWWLLKTRV